MKPLLKAKIFVWFCCLFSDHVTPLLKTFQQLITAFRIKVKSPDMADKALQSLPLQSHLSPLSFSLKFLKHVHTLLTPGLYVLFPPPRMLSPLLSVILIHSLFSAKISLPQAELQHYREDISQWLTQILHLCQMLSQLYAFYLLNFLMMYLYDYLCLFLQFCLVCYFNLRANAQTYSRYACHVRRVLYLLSK